MNMNDDVSDVPDQAMARRLNRLAAMPVDTSHLDRALKAQLSPRSLLQARWLRHTVALAASFVLLATVAIALLQERPVQASAAMMAQMHENIISGKIPTIKANSMDEANAAISTLYHNFPKLPQSPAAHVM